MNRQRTNGRAPDEKEANPAVIIYHRSRPACSLARCRARGTLNYFLPLRRGWPVDGGSGIVTFFTKINRVDKRVRSLNNQSRRGEAARRNKSAPDSSRGRFAYPGTCRDAKETTLPLFFLSSFFSFLFCCQLYMADCHENSPLENVSDVPMTCSSRGTGLEMG